MPTLNSFVVLLIFNNQYFWMPLCQMKDAEILTSKKSLQIASRKFENCQLRKDVKRINKDCKDNKVDFELKISVPQLTLC